MRRMRRRGTRPEGSYSGYFNAKWLQQGVAFLQVVDACTNEGSLPLSDRLYGYSTPLLAGDKRGFEDGEPLGLSQVPTKALDARRTIVLSDREAHPPGLLYPRPRFQRPIRQQIQVGDVGHSVIPGGLGLPNGWQISCERSVIASGARDEGGRALPLRLPHLPARIRSYRSICFWPSPFG